MTKTSELHFSNIYSHFLDHFQDSFSGRWCQVFKDDPEKLRPGTAEEETPQKGSTNTPVL